MDDPNSKNPLEGMSKYVRPMTAESLAQTAADVALAMIQGRRVFVDDSSFTPEQKELFGRLKTLALERLAGMEPGALSKGVPPASALPICGIQGRCFIDALHPMALDATAAYSGDKTPESAESLPVARVQGRLYLSVRHPRTPEAIRLLREHGSDGDFTEGVVTLLNYFPGAVEPFPVGTRYAGWPKESEPTAQA
jgi:hypothetical protein